MDMDTKREYMEFITLIKFKCSWKIVRKNMEKIWSDLDVRSFLFHVDMNSDLVGYCTSHLSETLIVPTSLRRCCNFCIHTSLGITHQHLGVFYL